MRVFIKVFIGTILAILLVIAFAEVLIRIFPRGANPFTTAAATGKKPTLMERALTGGVQKRINDLWRTRSVADRPHPFVPPFDVYVNRGFDDPQRMNLIFERTRLEPNKTWKVENFLLAPGIAPLLTYKITSNSLGFRGPERPLVAEPNRFRILVYGSYPAFGHAVNDEETYEQVMERNLNKARPGGHTFETWNGGRQGATAIMGLARLYKEEPLFKPDLLIWDFGWIELFLSGDQDDVKNKRMRNHDWDPVSRFGWRYCQMRPMVSLDLCLRYLEKLVRRNAQYSLDGWIEANRKMLEYAKAHRLPVILIRHSGVAIPAEHFKPFEDPAHQVWFVDTSASMLGQPALAEDIEAFWSKPNWTQETGATREEIGSTPGVIYRGDAIQYNARGLRIVGQTLADKVSDLILTGQLKKSSR